MSEEKVIECRCDCAECAYGNHEGCYYKPQPICCPYEITPRKSDTVQ
jgi:hypothetical protein